MAGVKAVWERGTSNGNFERLEEQEFGRRLRIHTALCSGMGRRSSVFSWQFGASPENWISP